MEDIAGIKLKRHYNLDAPKGVNGRNSDNTLIKKMLGWAPDIRLRDGMEKTYRWIYDQMTQLRKHVRRFSGGVIGYKKKPPAMYSPGAFLYVSLELAMKAFARRYPDCMASWHPIAYPDATLGAT